MDEWSRVEFELVVVGTDPVNVTLLFNTWGDGNRSYELGDDTDPANNSLTLELLEL